MPLTDKKTYRYIYRGEKGFGWFIVLIDETGFFSTVSDYGSYVYKWSAFEGDFRRFLYRCDSGYLIGKLNPHRVADWEQTYKTVKQRIVEERRGGYIHKEQARDLMRLADKFCKEQSDFAFKDFLDEAGMIYSHVDWYEFYCQRPEPQVVGFVEKLFPMLVEMIKSELKAEAA